MNLNVVNFVKIVKTDTYAFIATFAPSEKFRKIHCVEANKPGPAQVGAISKAQK